MHKTLSMSKVKTSDLLRDFFVNSTRKVVFFVGAIIALSMLEVNIGPFLAAMGAVGFVVGFALQGTLGNFAAGIMILLYRPYDIGQAVTVAGVTGKVDAMTLVSTTLLTLDNQTLVVPNGSDSMLSRDKKNRSAGIPEAGTLPRRLRDRHPIHHRAVRPDRRHVYARLVNVDLHEVVGALRIGREVAGATPVEPAASPSRHDVDGSAGVDIIWLAG